MYYYLRIFFLKKEAVSSTRNESVNSTEETESPIVQPFTSTEEKSPIHNQVRNIYYILFNTFFQKKIKTFSYKFIHVHDIGGGGGGDGLFRRNTYYRYKCHLSVR